MDARSSTYSALLVSLERSVCQFGGVHLFRVELRRFQVFDREPIFPPPRRESHHDILACKLCLIFHAERVELRPHCVRECRGTAPIDHRLTRSRVALVPLCS
ncbi:hypothetical protein ACFPRL_30000 [Pseudoclavibacter helvolus]